MSDVGEVERNKYVLPPVERSRDRSGLASADRGRDLRRLWRVGVGVKLGRNRVRRGRI
jgi:hypothetical protein